MTIDLYKVRDICYEFYFSNDSYDIHKDKNITYQEFVLIYNSMLYYGVIDSNDLKILHLEWNELEASKYNVMKIDKKWEYVLIDRSHGKKTSSFIDLSPDSLSKEEIAYTEKLKKVNKIIL